MQEPTNPPARAPQLERVLKGLGFCVLSVEDDAADPRQGMQRFKARFGPNLALNRLRARAADIARAMGGLTTPTLGAIPGDDRVAICFNDPSERTPIPLRPALETLSPAAIGTIPMLLGIDPEGAAIVQDLATAPHILIAGTTGSGKTTLVQQIIMSIVTTLNADDVGLVLVDPKMSDLMMFKNLPHISAGTVYCDPEEAIAALNFLADETLDERARLLAESEQSSVSELNRSAGKTMLRPIVVIVEELADLIDAIESAQERQRFLRTLTRLSQRARAAGLHLVLLTQRPSKDVLPARLKANLPTRLCLQLPSTADSMVVLDRPGAEKLGGCGDFLLRRDGQLLRGQGLYASRAELVNLVARLAPAGTRLEY